MHSAHHAGRTPVYLDNAASTPVAQEVVDAMVPFLRLQYGNPSSLHYFGRETNRAVQSARRKVAALVGASTKEIIFTSGGTESDNLAIKGTALAARRENPAKNHIVVSSIEHDAVLEPCRALQEDGFSVTYLQVTDKGLVEPDELRGAIGSNTALVSIMLANNEVGTIEPVRELSAVARSAGVPFHTDAVQAAGKIPVDVGTLGIDLLSISSHKINGPKGVGALYVRKGSRVTALMHGGGQESAMRSGTENVAGIVGFGAASELAKSRLESSRRHVEDLRDYLVKRVLAEIPDSRVNGSLESRLPGNAHFTFLGVNGEDLIIKLDENGVAASTGSACSIHRQKASHVLKAMGFSHEEITGSLRLTIGAQNTREEMDTAVESLKKVVVELRLLSPFKRTPATRGT
ncbi:MAG: cysteine desulfurase family protein [Nitrososphaera sp.]